MKRTEKEARNAASRSTVAGVPGGQWSPPSHPAVFWALSAAGWITLVGAGTLFLSQSSAVAGILALLSGFFLLLAAVFVVMTITRRLYSARHQAQQLEAFCKAIKQAADSLELQEILDAAAKVIVEVTDVRGCSIKLLDFRTKRLTARSVAGLEREKVDRALEAVEHMYQEGVMTRQSVIVRDVFMREFPSVNEEFESLICVPLRIEERLLGAICVFGEQGQRLSAEMISLLTSFGDVVSLAVAHALLYEALENVMETKTRFIFQTSHELRSPLNAIQSLAHSLLDGYLGEMSVEQRETIERIERRSQILAQVVGDLLVLAAGRAKLSTLKPAPVNLRKLLEESVDLFAGRAKEKHISVGLQCRTDEVSVLGNEQGLRSVVTNLLSNAIKYTPDGGRVTVGLADSGGCVELEVADTGIGIPAAERERLFTEFFRASNAKSITEKGTGLGLAIVKATVEQHGGTIDVETSEGKGTKFRVLLLKPKPGAPQTGADRAPDLRV